MIFFGRTLSSLHDGEGLCRVLRFLGRTGVVPHRAGRWGRVEDLSPLLSVRVRRGGPPTALLFVARPGRELPRKDFKQQHEHTEADDNKG